MRAFCGLRKRLLAALLSAALLACMSARAEDVPAPVPVKSVRLYTADEQTALRVGETLQILAEVTPSDAADQRLRFTCDDEAVATVDGEGAVTGVAPGVVTVRADAMDGQGAYGEITLTVKPVLLEHIWLSLEQKAICAGGKWPISVWVSPANATNRRVTWLSDDERVVRVEDVSDGSAILAGVGIGSAYVTACAEDGGGALARCLVEVRPAVTNVMMFTDNEQVEVNKGESLDVRLTVLPSEASAEVVWRVDDPDKASIAPSDGGAKCRLTGLAGGQVKLYAEAQDGSGACGELGIDVQVPLEAVSLPEQAVAYVGRTVSIAPRYEPEDTTYRLLRWSSANTQVAGVDENGALTGVSVGTVWVSARSATNPSIVGACAVNVVKPVTGVSLFARDKVIGQGGYALVEAAVTPSDAGNRELIYHSSNEAVLTVDAQGVITGIAPGSAVIRAEAADGCGAQAFLPMSVVDWPVSISLPPEILVVPGQQFPMVLNVVPSGMDAGALTWRSENDAVATVSEWGIVSCVAEGETTIHVASDRGLFASCRVVVARRMTGIRLTDETGRVIGEDETLEIDAGKSARIYAEALPLGIFARYTWTADNSRVALPRPEQYAVEGVNLGTAVITVTATEQGTERTVSRKLKVRVIQSVAEVTLPEEVRVLAGKTARVKASVTPSGAAHAALTWMVGDTAVASVSPGGVVTGVSPGETVLTATARNDVMGVCRVVVSQPVMQIRLTAPDIEERLNPGEKIALSAVALPAEADGRVAFKSSDKKIASVNAEGVVTAKKAGKVKITAIAQDGSGVKATVTLQVFAEVARLRINKRAGSLFVGGGGDKAPASLSLKAALSPKSAKNRPVIWSSGDEGVATVDQSGRVTAVGDGAAIITARSENEASDQSVVTVRTLPTQIELEQKSAALTVGERADLARFVRHDGTDEYLSWKSSNPKVAKVSKEGLVTGKKRGTATVTVRTRGGLTASCEVQVE